MVKSRHRRQRRVRGRRSLARAATTTDVLGGFPAKRSVNGKWRSHYKRLVELRNHLLKQRGELVRDAQEESLAFSEHMADAATDSYDRDFALSMLSSEQNALYEIDQAIHRIETGTYGVCEVTGEKIEAERLAAIPWTRFSAQAARDLERQGAVQRAKLAQPGSVAEAGAATLAAAKQEAEEGAAED